MDVELAALIPAILSALAPALAVLAKRQARRDIEQHARPAISSGAKVLLWFLMLVLIYAGFVTFWYWQAIQESADHLIFAVGLLLTMIAGMFVQGLAANYRAGRKLWRSSCFIRSGRSPPPRRVVFSPSTLPF